MLESIIDFINLKLGLLNYFEKTHCLSTLVKNDDGLIYPAEYISNGDFEAVDFDAYDGVSYIRVNGEIDVERVDQRYTPKPRLNVTFPLRLVYAVRKDKLTKDDAYSFDRVRGSLVKQLESDSADLANQLEADRIVVSTSNYISDTKELWDEETAETGTFQPKYEVVFGAMEVSVTVTTRAECIPSECDDFESDILKTFDFCKTNTQDRLTSTQVDCLTDWLCDGSGSPVTIQINGVTYTTAPAGTTYNQEFVNTDGDAVGTAANPSVVGDSTIQINGVSAGSVVAEGTYNQGFENSQGNTVGTAANPSIAGDATVTINGDSLGSEGSIPSEESNDITVNLDGSPSGSWNGTSWEVTSAACDDATVNANGVLVSNVASGGTLDIDVHDTDNNDVGTVTGTEIEIADSQAQVNGVNTETILATAIYNQLIQNGLGTSVGSSANPSIVADSSVTINSAAFGNVEAEGTIDIPVHDTDGADVGSVGGGQVEVGDATVTLNGANLGTTGDVVAEGSVDITVNLDGSPSGSWSGTSWDVTSSGGESRAWVRNPDWLPMPTTVDGDNVIYLLVAVRENVPNYLSMRATTSSGNYTVDLYNDSTTISNHASNTQADFDLDYTKGSNEIAEESYKQVIVKITGNLTAFDLYRRHPDVQASHGISTGVLSVKVTSQTITSLQNMMRGSTSTCFHKMMQEFEFFGTSNTTVWQFAFLDVPRLGKVKGDFSSGTNFNQAFRYSGDFDASEMSMPTTGITNLSQTFGETFKRSFTSATDVDFFKGVTYPASTFNVSNLQRFGTDTNRIRFDSLSNANGFYQMFQNAQDLTQAYFLESQTAPLGMFRTFNGCQSLVIVDAIDASGVTNMTQTFLNCFSLAWLRLVGITVSFDLSDCNFSREGLVQVFNDLGTATATITITNNPGVPDLTAADLLIATSKGWTVTT